MYKCMRVFIESEQIQKTQMQLIRDIRTNMKYLSTQF